MTHFFSCDWGASSFRLRCVNAATGAVIQERRESSGVRALFAGCPADDTAARERAFAGFLSEQLRSMPCGPAAFPDGAVVVISGMVSSIWKSP